MHFSLYSDKIRKTGGDRIFWISVMLEIMHIDTHHRHILFRHEIDETSMKMMPFKYHSCQEPNFSYAPVIYEHITVWWKQHEDTRNVEQSFDQTIFPDKISVVDGDYLKFQDIVLSDVFKKLISKTIHKFRIFIGIQNSSCSKTNLFFPWMHSMNFYLIMML